MANPTSIIKDSVRVIPPENDARSSLILYFAQANEKITPWNSIATAQRDKELTSFWMSEPFLASAVTSIAMTRAALSWEISGPPKTAAKLREMLNGSNFGQGWQHLTMQVGTDILGTDNGGFIEIIRDKPPRGRSPESMPVVGLAHLPSLSCVRTGNPMQPVIYTDRNNNEHKLKWYQVACLVENPIPNSETGRQLCFVSRVLGFAQMIRDIEIHHGEKLSGRFNKAIHVLSGVAQGEIEQIRAAGVIDANNAGLMRYGQPLILTTLDPNARLSKETIELASLPDGFDFDQMLNWYITLLALASGSDYQEFAPLSSGNLGSAEQSDTLHRKSQRKGTQLFIKLVETALHQTKVIPASITFQFKQQDAQAEAEQANIEKTRAQTRALQIKSGEITPEVARQIAVDKSDLKQQYLLMMGEQDTTPDVTISDDETVAEELLNLTHSNIIKPVTTGEDHSDAVPEEEITIGKAIDPRIATRTALWWAKQINEHPLQAMTPIPYRQLWQFTEALKNVLRSGVTGTTVGWMSSDLVRAAQLSGIHPHALRLRLPDEYTTVVQPEYARDNKQLIACIEPTTKSTVKTQLDMIIDNFVAKYPNTDQKGALLKEAIVETYKIARGDEITETDFETLKRIIADQLALLFQTNDVQLLTLGLYKTYYKFS